MKPGIEKGVEVSSRRSRSCAPVSGTWCAGSMILATVRQIGKTRVRGQGRQDGVITVEGRRLSEASRRRGMQSTADISRVIDDAGDGSGVENPAYDPREENSSRRTCRCSSRCRRGVAVTSARTSGEALAPLVVNKLLHAQAEPVKAPGCGDRSKARLRNRIYRGSAIRRPRDRSEIKLEDWHGQEVTIDKENTTIVAGAGSPQAIEVRSADRARRRHGRRPTTAKAQERLASRCGVAHQVGAPPRQDEEKGAREGPMPRPGRGRKGSGTRRVGAAARPRRREASGRRSARRVEIIRRASRSDAPHRRQRRLKVIVVQKVKDAKNVDEGFNAATETYEDLVKAGVIDPAKVVRNALQNASSIASLLLTTEALVSEIPEDKKEAPSMPGGGGMGGMY